MLLLAVLAGGAGAQVDEICSQFGFTPTRDEPGAKVSYIYGRILLKGLEGSVKFPNVSVNYLDARQSRRLTIENSGNYCFRRSGGGGGSGTLIVEVDGVEAVRRSLSFLGPEHQRDDLEIQLTGTRSAPPGVISAKLSRPRNEKTADLYRRAADAESGKNVEKAIKYVGEILAIDSADFVAWAKLGSLHLARQSLSDAETAFRKSLELKPDYAPALINLGMLRAVQKQFEAAVEIFKQAVAADPTSGSAYRMLGEAYLQIRKGSLGLEALNQAIRLDPIGMAECHLLMARLYDLAGARNLASREYKIFLTKVPNDPDKKKFEQYIKDNPE